MSRHLFGSSWVDLERSTAIFRDPTNKQRRLIPVLFSSCAIPDTLKRYRYIDYTRPTNTAFNDILAAINASSKSLEKRHINKRKKTIQHKLLVVDDDQFFLDDVALFLEDEGFHVLTTASADDAFNILKKQCSDIDLVLLDLMMLMPDNATLLPFMRVSEETGIFVSKVRIENGGMAAGNMLSAHVTMENSGNVYLDDIKLTMIVQELAARGAAGPFDLERGDKLTKNVVLRLGDEPASGSYYARFTISNGKAKRVFYRPILIP